MFEDENLERPFFGNPNLTRQGRKAGVKPEGTQASERIMGVAEPIATLGSGVLGFVPAMVEGVVRGSQSGETTQGGLARAREEAFKNAMERYTYMPQTELGKENVVAIGEGIEKFMDVTKLPPVIPQLQSFTGVMKGVPTQARALLRESNIAPDVPTVVNSLKNLPVGASIKPLDELTPPKSEITMESVPPQKAYAPADELGFYSNIEKASLNLQRKSGSGDAFLNDIMKQPGVNKEELEFMGLQDFLKGRKGVTREEVQDFVKNNRIQFEEKVLGGNRMTSKQAVLAQKEFDELVNGGAVDDATVARMNELAEIIQGNRQSFKAPEYATVARTPGGDNYREILIKLPDTSLEKKYDDISMELYGRPWKELGSDYQGFVRHDYVSRIARDSRYTGQHFNKEKDVLVHMRVDDRIDKDNKVGMLLDEIQSDWHQAGRTQGYRKGKTTEIDRLQAQIADLQAQYKEAQKSRPNNTGYVLYDSKDKHRSQVFNTREEAQAELQKITTPDNPVRIVNSYRTSPELEAWERKYAPIRREYDEKSRRLSDLREELKYVEDEDGEPITPVPNAPFKENYHELAMKRALVEGAKGDYDRIYLPTGDDLVNRYKQALTKEVDEVRLKKLPNGRYDFVATKNGNPVAGEKDISAGRVREMLGKAAEDLIKKAEGQVGGQDAVMKAQDLRVGGEGMRKYYDEVYPSFLKKFAKKYGGTIGKTEIETGARSSILDALSDAGMTIDEFNALDADAQTALYQKYQRKKTVPVFYYEFSPEAKKKILGGLPMKKGGRVRFSNNPDVQMMETFSKGGSAKLGMKGLLEKIRNMRGGYEARRFERALDEVPNLEKQYNEDALYGLFSGDNARGIMTMSPKDFEKFATPIKDTSGRVYSPKPNLDMTHQEYVNYLADVARNQGFDSVPFLELNEQYYKGLLPYVSGHEGRHRTRALSSLGDEKTLVQMLPRSALRESYPRRSREEYLDAIKGKIGERPLVIPQDRTYPNPRKMPMTDELESEMYNLRYKSGSLTDEEYQRLNDLELMRDAPKELPDWKEAKQLPELYSAGGAVAKSAIEKMREMLAKKAIQQDLSGESKRMAEYLRTGKMPEAKAVTPEEIEAEYLRKQKEGSPPMKKGGKVHISKNLDAMRLAIKR